jgi:hypothetical protein
MSSTWMCQKARSTSSLTSDHASMLTIASLATAGRMAVFYPSLLNLSIMLRAPMPLLDLLLGEGWFEYFCCVKAPAAKACTPGHQHGPVEQLRLLVTITSIGHKAS